MDEIHLMKRWACILSGIVCVILIGTGMFWFYLNPSQVPIDNYAHFKWYLRGLPWYRPICLILFLVSMGYSLTYFKHKKTRLVVFLWIATIISPLCPIDLTFRNVPGPPRFVPFVMGYVSEKGRLTADRGEIVLGGCECNGYEPKWVLVW